MTAPRETAAGSTKKLQPTYGYNEEFHAAAAESTRVANRNRVYGLRATRVHAEFRLETVQLLFGVAAMEDANYYAKTVQ